MLDTIISELKKYNIDLVSCISLSECEIVRPYLLERYGIDRERGSVVIFAVPYLSRDAARERNISAYAVSRDYHAFFKSLFDDILPRLRSAYPTESFVGFTDHSPIAEIDAASRAGLGVRGKNHLLITPKYSSFVFIGEIITGASLPSRAGEPLSCIGCGKCLVSCPCGTDISMCLSSLTQKKGELDAGEKERIRESGCAWGCDICQEVCPHTRAAINAGTIYTNVDFFNSELTPVLTSEAVEAMSDEDLAQRAYSWRGRKTIVRNLKILEEKES